MRPAADHASASIKRFIEHLLPEGRALDVAVDDNGLAKTNIFGLIWPLGAETARALRFAGDGTAERPASEPTLRDIPIQELDQRIAECEHVPLTIWDGKVRMSVAGLQDKLLVYLDRPLLDGGRLFLVDGQRLASTHILKPDTANPHTPHLAVNEHFCMSLARRMKLPVAEVDLLRTPRPVLVVRRFDREVETAGGQPRVHRRHIIDACQACDLPVAYKYERNLGSAEAVRHIRDGVSFERLFGCADLTANKAAARLAMLRWALFQSLIGNSDAHGKNFSFFVRPGGLLEPTPWYELVSILPYDGFDTEVAKLAAAEAAEQARAPDYEGEAELTFVQGIAAFVAHQADRLTKLVADAARWKDEDLDRRKKRPPPAAHAGGGRNHECEWASATRDQPGFSCLVTPLPP